MEMIARATIACLFASLLPFVFFFPLTALDVFEFAPFLIWILVYAVGLGLFAGLSSRFLARLPSGVGFVTAIGLGVIAALLFSWALTLVGGPWIAFPAWIVGGAVGMVVAQPPSAEHPGLPPALAGTLPMIMVMSAVLLAFLSWLLLRLVVR